MDHKTGKFILIALTLPALLITASRGQNLVDNGGFEAGYNNGWTHLAGDGASAAFSEESANPYEGARALKAQINSLGANSWSVQTLGPTPTLTVGEEYILTFRGRAATAGTSVRMVLQNALFRSRDQSLGTEWAEYSWTFTAEEATPRLKMHYFQAGTVWLDDIRLSPVVVNTNPVQVAILPDIRYQTMAGFGGGLTWYSSWVYHGSAANAAQINQLMFEDLGLDVLRLKNWYYPNNYPASIEPVSMPEQEAFEANQDFYAAAKSINPDIQVLLSSWSPPASLKSNGTRENGGTLKRDADGYLYDELAQYWVDALDHLGWTPDYLSIQNEPGFSATWESCILRPTETAENAGYAEAADAVWNAIKDRPDVPRMLGSEAENIGNATWSDWNGGNTVNTFEALNAPLLSRPYFAAHGYHLYNIWNESQIDNVSAVMNMVRDSFGDRPNWMTEYSKGDFDWLQAARVVHNTVVDANTSAYIYWELIWDSGSSSAMIGINWNGSYVVNDHYYMLKHYAKHVDKGYQRIEVSVSNNDLKVSGFVSADGRSITLVAINKSDLPQQIDLVHDVLPIDTVAGYQSVSGSFYQPMAAVEVNLPIDLPARSMTTLVLGLSHSVNEIDSGLVYLYDPTYSGGVFTVKVPDQSGILFSLWETDDLTLDSWTKVTNAMQTAAGGEITFADPAVGPFPRYYRIKAEN